MCVCKQSKEGKSRLILVSICCVKKEIACESVSVTISTLKCHRNLFNSSVNRDPLSTQPDSLCMCVSVYLHMTVCMSCECVCGCWCTETNISKAPHVSAIYTSVSVSTCVCVHAHIWQCVSCVWTSMHRKTTFQRNLMHRWVHYLWWWQGRPSQWRSRTSWLRSLCYAALSACGRYEVPPQTSKQTWTWRSSEAGSPLLCTETTGRQEERDERTEKTQVEERERETLTMLHPDAVDQMCCQLSTSVTCSWSI